MALISLSAVAASRIFRILAIFSRMESRSSQHRYFQSLCPGTRLPYRMSREISRKYSS